MTFGLAVTAAAAPSHPARAHTAGEVSIETRSLAATDGQTVSYELGTLFVPENRRKSDSRLIGVGFARFKAQQPSDTPPILLLPGGPGGSYLMRLNEDNRRGQMLATIERYQRVSDVVIVDQRGFSEQGEVLKFKYTSTDGAGGGSPGGVASYQALARKIVEHFAATGVDLSGYTVKECAADVNDLRAALGYKQIVLSGTSFGSQWSFAIMRLHPQIVARALLSGVEPLNDGYDMPSHVYAAYQRMWWAVEQDERFKPYVPSGGIGQAALTVKERLERGQIRVNDTLLGAGDFPGMEPAAILAFYYGHYESWLQRRDRQQQDKSQEQEMTLIGPLIDSSLGVTPERRNRLWTDPAIRFFGRDNFEYYLATADIWPSPDVGDDFRTPVASDIPVVFAQGDWDTSTPIENTYEIAPYFSRGHVLVAEQGSHGVLEPIAEQLPQVWQTLETFLRTGETAAIPVHVKLKPVRRFAAPNFAPPGNTP